MEKMTKLTESILRRKIQEAVQGVLMEYDSYEPDEDYQDYGEPESASDDFYNSGCIATLKEKYPGMEFEFDVEDDGTVTVLDINTGKYYIGSGEVEYRTVGLGYPSHNDYDSEAEGESAYYDYYNCLKGIMAKIDNDKPDGIEDGYMEVSEGDIREAIQEVLNFF